MSPACARVCVCMCMCCCFTYSLFNQWIYHTHTHTVEIIYNDGDSQSNTQLFSRLHSSVKNLSLSMCVCIYIYIYIYINYLSVLVLIYIHSIPRPYLCFCLKPPYLPPKQPKPPNPMSTTPTTRPPTVPNNTPLLSDTQNHPIWSKPVTDSNLTSLTPRKSHHCLMVNIHRNLTTAGANTDSYS